MKRWCTFLVLLPAACGPAGRTWDRQFAAAQADFDQGRYPAVVEAAAKAVSRTGPDSQWHWRFRLLEARAESLLDARAVKRTLADPAPAAFPEIEIERKILLAKVLLKVDRDTNRAGELLAPAIAAAEARGDLRLALEARMAEARRLYLERKVEPADRLLLDVLARARKANLEPLMISSLVNLGMIRLAQERCAESIPFSEEVIRLTAVRPNGDHYRARNNLGICYSRLGEFERAVEQQKAAIAGFERLHDDKGMMEALGELAATYYLSGALDQAAAGSERAFRLAEKAGLNEDAARLATNVAWLNADRGNWREAARFNDQALQLKRRIGARTGAFNELNRARIAAATGDTALAARLFGELIENHDFATLAWDARLGLAQIASGSGDSGAARAHYEAAIQGVEASRLELEKADLRLSYFVRLIDFYRRYVDFLMEQHDVMAALSVAESSRAKVLAERTKTRGVSRMPAGAFQRLAAESNSVLLSYWLSPRASYLWVITGTAVKAVPLPPGPEIAKLVEDYTAALRNGIDPLAFPRESGVKLARILLEPAAGSIPKNARVIVVPDGALHDLNFETLIHEGRYWIESAQITVAPSLAVIAAAAPRPAAPAAARSLLLVGNPVNTDPKFPRLEHAAREMDVVAATFPASNRTVLSAERATPDAFLQAQVRNGAFIHFTAHAFANRSEPLNSAVVLSPGPSGRSMLYARDLMDLNRSAELVAVSACRGAGARAYSGEGLVGFAWAFLRAGAGRVVAGLWDVDDEATASLMRGLYQKIGAGNPPAAALRQAKLVLLHDRAYAKPYFWGAFQMYVAVR